jgi:hypothetical protein
MYWRQRIFDRGIRQNDSYFLVLVYILALFEHGLGRFRTSSGVEGCVQLLKQKMIIWENLQNRRKFTVTTGSCCLHRSGSYICNIIFHKFLILKDIASEQVNSRKQETCFGICNKKKSGAKVC